MNIKSSGLVYDFYIIIYIYILYRYKILIYHCVTRCILCVLSTSVCIRRVSGHPANNALPLTETIGYQTNKQTNKGTYNRQTNKQTREDITVKGLLCICLYTTQGIFGYRGILVDNLRIVQ